MTVSGGELEITCTAVKSKQKARDAFWLLDCRERGEHELVVIDGSRLLPMSEVVERIDELQDVREQSVIVYCHHGMRSLQVAGWLEQKGFVDVKSMAGGIEQWAVEVEPGMTRY